MPDNNMMIMLGLGAAALWFMNRGGSQEDQVDQLAGAAMMASGEGTAPDAPFQAYSAPTQPVFFFNQGGQMAKIPGSNVPLGASTDEDIGQYPGGQNRPELEFTVARSVPPSGTTDISPTTPEFEGNRDMTVIPSTIWDAQYAIAAANEMPLLAIGNTESGGIDILGGSVDIATLDSKERFRAVKPSGFAYTTTGDVLMEYVKGFTGTPAAPATNATIVSQTPAAPFVGSTPSWATHEDAWWNEG